MRENDWIELLWKENLENHTHDNLAYIKIEKFLFLI